MLQAFKKHIESNNFFPDGSKILATVSGGVDSVVLCYLLKELNVDFSIVHCNFKLRGVDSDEDEKFVKSLAQNLDVDFYSKSFETKKYSLENGISTQMAARELRYNWFDELKSEHNFDYIITAHHKNDNVETVLLNLVRGTSHKGLVGIKSKNNEIIRPLLAFSKDEILNYAKINNIEWREDVSNQENKYKRNLVRNEIVTLFEKLNPNFLNTFSENIEKFREESKALSSLIKNHENSLEIENLKNSESSLFQIWGWIEQFGFTFSDAKDVLNGLNGQSGKEYYSQTHRLVKDRTQLIMEEINQKVSEEIIIDGTGSYSINGTTLEFSRVYMVNYGLGENIAFINSNKLKFPLKLRKWRKGDKFKPLGMKGQSKLVSDFLIDEKVSLIDKEKQLVIESKDGIVWVVGRRVSEDFKVFAEDSTIKIEVK